jgi:hypothetical protein
MCCENAFPFPIDVALKLSAPQRVIPAETERQRSGEPGPIPTFALNASVHATDDKLLWEATPADTAQT